MRPMIEARGISKLYHIGAPRARYGSLRDSIASWARAPFRRRSHAERDPTIWALKDVSFDVMPGEVIGIIGRNGAGKSTLLKVLSRITEPTEGQVRLFGRIASLLEVGTGFHPELTGRENVFLNGAVLGMKRAQIEQQFDAIVSFAEIEKFIDTPVKHYSSGMYLKLGFAVAAHLEPEILVIDEVLAVGDSSFQKKCLRKIGDVARSGRTVLFVSHNLGAVQTLCERAILLHNGRVVAVDDVASVTHRYVNGLVESVSSAEILPSQHIRGDGRVLIKSASLWDGHHRSKGTFLIGESFELRFRFRARTPIRGTFWFFLVNSEGTVVMSSFQKDTGEPSLLSKEGEVSVTVSSINLQPGMYVVSAGIFDSMPDAVDWVEGATTLEILPQFVDGRSFDHRYGLVSQELTWSFRNPEVLSTESVAQ
jgi:lipopolysaccharide transport system ATP-binding protein